MTMGVLSALFAAGVLPLVPYEISEAGRTSDGGPALCALEDASGWRVSATDCEAELVSATNRALFGKGVARLRYRSKGTNAVVRLTPEASVGIDRGINAVSLWVWGHLLPYRRNPEDPQPIAVSAILRDGAGEEIEVDLRNTNHANWFLLHRYLAPEEQARMANGGELVALVFRGMANTGWKDIDITSLRAYRDELKPIAVTPRARRGYANFPEADQGFNTGKGRLPFPNTELTVTPPVAPETKVEWRFPEKAGSWDDFAFRYDGGEWQRFAVGGGVYFRGTTGEADSLSDLDVCGVKMRNNRPGRAMKRATVEDGQFVRTKDGAVFKGKFLTDEGEAGEGEIRFRTVGQSVIVDIWIRGGAVEEVRFGRWTDAPSSAKLIEVPFYTYRRGRATDKPSVVMAELAPGSTVFFAAAMDWTQSAASLPYCFLTNGKGVAANGATTYRPDTGGRKNDCRERFVWSVSPKFDEVLPNIPNPPSPYRARMSEKVFISYASKDVAKAKGFFRRLKDEGLKHLLVTDHEDMWRDDFESFTFRDTCAPARGGDEAQRAYTRYLRDELGYDYGPYNTFLDLAPVNRYWDTDRIMRSADGQLMGGWQRCYVPKVHFACEMNEVLTPVVQRKFGFNCAYCDQHTLFTPWTRIEYDHRVPGAATFAQTFYGFGELLLKQRELFGGPVFSEGGCHFMYAGLCDGSYAQEYEYSHAGHDWLVDFDLLRMHPLGCDVATSPAACFRKTPGGMPSDRDYAFDYFIAAEMAYGHLGRMGRSYDKYEKRLYFMMQAIGAKYGRANVRTIRYLGADGRPRTTSEALKDGSISLCHVCVRYDDGTSVLANGSYGDAATNMTVRLKDRTLTLPSGGVYAESGDRSVVVWCALGADGKRERYARSAEYEYVENGTTVEVKLK